MCCCFAALGLPLDLEIGKRSSTSTTSLDSLSFVGLQGYVLYGYTSARCLYLVDRSWYIVVPIVGKILFSMLRTLHLLLSCLAYLVENKGGLYFMLWNISKSRTCVLFNKTTK